jgi:phosphatidylglycerophosphate synthase
MIDKWLSKSKVNHTLEKLVRNLLSNRITANQITIIGFGIGLLSAVFIFLSGLLVWELEFIIVAVILMLISFFFDTLDGALARLVKPTKFGGILDIFCDRAVEISIILSIVSTNPILLWPGLLSLASIVLCITMFLLVGGAIKPEDLEDNKKVVYYRHGLIERSETLILLFLMIILVPIRLIILWIFFGLVLITALIRLKDAYRILKGK